MSHKYISIINHGNETIIEKRTDDGSGHATIDMYDNIRADNKETLNIALQYLAAKKGQNTTTLK